MGRIESDKVSQTKASNVKLLARRKARLVPPPAAADLNAVIEARVQAIYDAHANNLIEGADMGADGLCMLLALARRPITNEEFTLLAKRAIDDL